MEYTMESTLKRVFTHEYQADAVKLVTEQGMRVKDAAGPRISPTSGLTVDVHSRMRRN